MTKSNKGGEGLGKEVLSANSQKKFIASRGGIISVQAYQRLVTQNAVLVEALKKAGEDFNWMLNNKKFLNHNSFEYIYKALKIAEGR